MRKEQMLTSKAKSAIFRFCVAGGLTAIGFGAGAQQVAGNKSDELTEIVVTGSKLGRDLGRVPVAVTSYSPELILRDGVASLDDISLRTPSLDYSNPTNFAQAYIRGIGTNYLLSGLESSVATYIDDAYIQRQAGADLSVVDVASIDVLKGPQGTLYGRNATGGAIIMQTSDPKQKFEGFASAEYGTYGHTRFQGVVNLPLSETIALRIAAENTFQHGFLADTGVPGGSNLGEAHSSLVRAKIAWAPSELFEAIYTLEYSRQASNAYSNHQRFTDTRCLACAIFQVVPSQGFYDATVGPDPMSTVEYVANNLRIFGHVGDVLITSVTSNRNQKLGTSNEQDYTSADLAKAVVFESGPTFTEDVFARSSFAGPLNFLAGVSYERDRGTLDTQLIGAAYGGEISSVDKVRLDSYSGYAEGYFEFADGFKFTGGARYNVDKKVLDASNGPASVGFFNALGAPIPAAYSVNATFKSWTPRAVLAYEKGGNLYYASYSRGVKSGGFSTPAFALPNTISPETLDNFELGAKQRFFDGRIRTTTALFYGNYKDIQVAHVGFAGVETQNAAAAKTRGVEFDVQWKATDALDLDAGITFLHNRFSSYAGAAVLVPTGAVPGIANGAADLSGTRLPRSPDWAGYLAAYYTVPIVAGWKAAFSPVARYTGDYDFYAGRGGPFGLDYQRAFTLLDATLGLKDPSETLEIQLYGKNLGNRKYFVTAETTTFGAFYVAAEPITYGLRVSKKF